MSHINDRIYCLIKGHIGIVKKSCVLCGNGRRYFSSLVLIISLVHLSQNVLNLTDTGSKEPGANNIGYMDAQYFYLHPEASYTAVCRVYRDKGEAFPLTSRILHKQMAEDGLIAPDTTGGKNTRNKSIAGKPVRLLWVPRVNLEGPRVVNEQLRIDPHRPLDDQGFTQVNEPTPFDK